MKKTNLISVLFLLAFIILSVPGQSAVIHVPSEQPDIQSGIDAAFAGDTVLVASGTYSGANNRDLRFNGKAITVVSESGPNSCLIDLEEAARCVTFSSGESRESVFSGFKVINGHVTGNGGAVYLSNSSATIRNCRFESNFAADKGGGVNCFNSNAPLFDDCDFRNNESGGEGGVFRAYNSPGLEIVNCTFNSNTAGGYGGAVSLFSTDDTTISGCAFSYNHSDVYGGALYINETTDTLTTETEFSHNSAAYSGGAVFAENAPSRFCNCSLSDNSSPNGAGFYLYRNTASMVIEISNCLIVTNTASNSGGGISCHQSYLNLFQSTIADNSQGLYVNHAVSDVVARNSVFYGNVHGNINVASGVLDIAYSLVQGGWPGGSNIIDADPEFVEGYDGDYYLNHRTGSKAISPCIDAGDGLASYACYPGMNGDECMRDRTTEKYRLPDSGTVDIGYHYPVPAPRIIYVPNDTPTIGKAIGGSSYGDTILVADGTYQSPLDANMDFDGRHITVMSENGPDNCRIITGKLDHAFYFHSGEGNDSIVRGFMISCASGVDMLDYGGAILCENGSAPMLYENYFYSNSAWNGGAVACLQSDPKIVSCKFSDNYAGDSGGGIYCFESEPELFNCLMSQNSASTSGAGIYIESAAGLDITQCTMIDNSISGKESGGGGVYSAESEVTVLNSIMFFNDPENLHFTGTAPNVTYSDIGGATTYPGTGNINLDPELDGSFLRFTSPVSPCIDAGSDLASAICTVVPEGNICMNALTTRSDSVTDWSMVDMGYHRQPWIFPSATPTVTPTPTITPTETITPTPTSTPTPDDWLYISDDYTGCPGDQIVVQLMMRNNTTAVASITLDLSFEPDMLSYVSCSEGDLNPPWEIFDSAELEPGHVRIAAFALSPNEIPVGSEGSFAELTLNVTCAGCASGEDCAPAFVMLQDDIENFNTDNGLFTFCINGTPTPTSTPTTTPTSTSTPTPTTTPTSTPTSTPTVLPTSTPTFTPTIPPTSTPSPQCIHSGDADDSGVVTAGDAQLAFRIALGIIDPDPDQECRADCDGIDPVTAGDAQKIFRVALQLQESCADPV